MAVFVGAAVMAIGGLAEAFLGVRSEGKNLEDIAAPLTAPMAASGSPSGDSWF